MRARRYFWNHPTESGMFFNARSDDIGKKFSSLNNPDCRFIT
jgi:hypothetical protein